MFRSLEADNSDAGTVKMFLGDKVLLHPTTCTAFW